MKSLDPYRRQGRESRSLRVSTNIKQLQTHQTTTRKRYFYPRRPGVWKRGTRHLYALTKSINLAVTYKHTTQQC